MKQIIEAKKYAHFLSKKKGIKLKEALEYIAKENNFSNWKSYKDSLDTFWYKKSSPFLNHWFSLYLEAKKIQKDNSGFLLTYKGQFFIAPDEYIEHLGIDPQANIWKKINYDINSADSLEKFYKYYILAKKI